MKRGSDFCFMDFDLVAVYVWAVNYIQGLPFEIQLALGFCIGLALVIGVISVMFSKGNNSL